MKNLDIALCDLDEDYIMRFASYVMDHVPGAGIHIFTTSESYYEDSNRFDVEIMTEDFEELSSFRKSEKVGHRYILSEQKELSGDCDRIYKYQSMEVIFNQIQELDVLRGKKIASIKSKGKSKIIGVYSPVSHELQLPFSLALSQSLRNEGRVLFLDLEEMSIMPELINSELETNLLDFLYEVNTNKEKLNINDYTCGFAGIEYIEPFRNPGDIAEIEEDSWERLFSTVVESDKYDVIVVLFGRAINGFGKFLEKLEALYILGRPGDYFKKSQDAFIEYLSRANLDIDFKSVILPMSAGNLSEGAYLLEELLQGNLGLFVRRLIENDERESA